MEELGFVKDFQERKYYFSLFPLSINGEHFTDEDKEYMQFMIDTHELDTLVNANEIYRNKRIIYYDRDEGCVCMGIIQSVSLKESPNPRDESEKHKCLDFIINGKKYEYKYFNNDSDIMIDHGLSYDGTLPEEIVFGSFDNALRKLESYNKGEKIG